MKAWRTGAIALGSNLGDREKTLASAVRGFERSSEVTVLRRSPWIETEPVGGPPDQPLFLNGVVSIETRLEARELLSMMMQLEERAGRDRSTEPANGPRTLDLDLLFLGDLVIEEPGLSLPHPRMRGRRFVLEPLCAVLPDVPLPPDGRTPRELFGELVGEAIP